MTRGKQKIEAQRKNAEKNKNSKGSQLEARAVGLKVICPICKVNYNSNHYFFVFVHFSLWLWNLGFFFFFFNSLIASASYVGDIYIFYMRVSLCFFNLWVLGNLDSAVGSLAIKSKTIYCISINISPLFIN